ncbi:cell filamentation protein Fic, partial [Helicobacter monodelphidis]
MEELFYREREISNKKTIELNANPIQGNFDYQHLKDIHKYIFQDIFTWAGKDRFELK